MVFETDYARNPDYYKQKAREWAATNPEKRRQIVARNNAKRSEQRRAWHDMKRFGCVLRRDNCERCLEPSSGPRNLVVHHRDGNNGKTGKPLNNDRKNLVVVCRSCHATVHSHGRILEVV